MAKRILICGHNLYGYHESMADGFAAHGWNASCFAHENTSIRKLESHNWFKRKQAVCRIRQINHDLLELAARERPDVTLCINAEALLPETIQALNAKSTPVLWLADAFRNIKQDRQTLELFSRIFVFEPTDTAILPQAVYLPYGADVTRYHPLTVEKKYDVTFVGADHVNRLPILNEISRFCAENGWSFGVLGPFRSFQRLLRGRRVRREFPWLAQAIVCNRKLTPDEVNGVYNSSRINLNIHHEQSVEGVNPRTFEIPASGGFQLVDRKPSLNRALSEGQEVACYEGMDDVKEKIRYYLSHAAEREKIAVAGMERVHACHTFRNRCRTVLDLVCP